MWSWTMLFFRDRVNVASVTIEQPVWNAKHLVWEISILCCGFSLTSFLLTPWTTFLFLIAGWSDFFTDVRCKELLLLAWLDSTVHYSLHLHFHLVTPWRKNPTPNPSCGVAQWLQQRKRVQLGVNFHSCVTEACECELHVLWRLRNSRLRAMVLACQLASSRFFWFGVTNFDLRKINVRVLEP